MLFRTERNGISVEPINAAYDFTQRSYFRIGDERFYYKDLRLQVGKIKSTTRRGLKSSQSFHKMIGFVWPDKIASRGKLDFISPVRQRKFFSVPVNDESLKNWLSAPERIRKSVQHLIGRSRLSYHGKPLRPKSVNFGFYPVPDEFKKIMRKTFRFCVDQEREKSHIRICSPYYRLHGNGQFTYVPIKASVSPPRFLLNGRPVGGKGLMSFSKDQTLDFFAQLPNGVLLSIKGKEKNFKIDQVVQAGNNLELLGHGDGPQKAEVVSDPSKFVTWLEAAGWGDSIEPRKDYWRREIDKDNPVVPVLSAGLDVLGKKIVAEKGFPKKEHIIELNDPKRTTYSKKLKFEGKCRVDCKLRASEGDKLMMNGKTFEWVAQIPKRKANNKLALTVLDGSKEWIADYEVIQVPSTEISARFSGLASLQGAFSVLGEVSVNHWFESLFGWQNKTLSFQRWGVSVKHFQSFADLIIAENFPAVDWSTTNVDLKYRLASGVWGVDETVGLMASYQNTVLGDETLPLIGGGIFWARSMPVIFDYFFNIIPFLRYPKWVDVEFIYYPMTTDPKAQVVSVWNLNFHGKVQWSPTYFGELGFGMRQVNFVGSTSGLGFQFTTAYITAGVGFQF